MVPVCVRIPLRKKIIFTRTHKIREIVSSFIADGEEEATLTRVKFWSIGLVRVEVEEVRRG